MANYNSWKDLYRIDYDEEVGKRAASFWNNIKRKFKDEDLKNVLLIERASGNIVGRYDSVRYAQNRARFKFKRQMRLLDRMLLSRAE